MRPRNVVGIGLAFAALAQFAAPLFGQEAYRSYSFGQTRRGIGEQTFGFEGMVLLAVKDGNRPLAMFGIHKPPNEKSRFLYLAVFKTPREFEHQRFLLGKTEVEALINAGEYHALGKGHFVFGKRRVDYAFKFFADSKNHELVEKSFNIGGQEYKGGDPVVMVVDLTKDIVECIPVKMELPRDALDLNDASSWPMTVLEGIRRLKEQSPELKELLD